MAINDIDLGTAPDNGTGDEIRDGGAKINANFAYLDLVKLEKASYEGTADDLVALIAAKKEPLFVAALPNPGVELTLYINTTAKTLHYWNGTAYVDIGGTGGTGSINITSVSGWADYVDTVFTDIAPFALTVADGKVNMPNNGGGGVRSEMPLDLTDFYNSTTQKFLGKNGDMYAVDIEFSVRPTSAASDIRIFTSIDIGGTVGEIYPFEFGLTKGSGNEHYYLASFHYYTLGTFEANGGSLKVQTINGPVEIYNIRYIFDRRHKAGNSYAQSSSITSDNLAAILNAANPSAANPYATVADLGGGIEDQIVDGVVDKGASQNAIFDALALKVDDSQVLTDVPVNAVFTDTVYDDTAIQADVDSKTKKRTIKVVPNTTQHTLKAADFTDFILQFTANAGEEISVVLNAGVAPLNGELIMFSSGNNFLVPSQGTGVTATFPEGAIAKTVSKGLLGGIVSGTDTIYYNGSLQSDESYADIKLSNLADDLNTTEKDAIDAKLFKNITENQYSTHPAFSNQADLNAWLLNNLNGGNGINPSTSPNLVVSNISHTGLDYQTS